MSFDTVVVFRMDSTFIFESAFSEVLILASANPQYDKRLSIDLPLQYIKIPNLEHGENVGRTWGEHVT